MRYNPPRNWPNELPVSAPSYPQHNAGGDNVVALVPRFGTNLPEPPPIDYAALESALEASPGYTVAEALSESAEVEFMAAFARGVQS